MPQQTIHVAVAVIKNQQGQILIQQRAKNAHQGGLWEFPGGKVENGETLQQALRRELFEELAIEVKNSRPLIQIQLDYGDRHVLLDVHQVLQFSGNPESMENQPLQWVTANDLNNWAMPAADVPIVNAIQLPSSCVITPSSIDDVDTFLEKLETNLKLGDKLFIYRVKQLIGSTHDRLISQMFEIIEKYQARLLVHEKNTGCIEGHGVHLTEKSLFSYREHGSSNRLLSASCHSLAALLKAQDIGATFALLSPVNPTSSHPGAPVLGWESFADIVEQANLPVYALGGMTRDDLEVAWQQGAQGIAGISEWWS